MKKIIVALGVAAVAFGFSACNKGGESAAAGEGSDSLSILLGQAQGATYLGYWDQMPDTMKAKLSKDQFIKGFSAVMQRGDEDEAYIMGAGVAMQLRGHIKQFTDAGVKFDKAKFIKNFAEAFKGDSVDNAKLQKVSEELRVYMDMAQEKMMAKQQADRQRMLDEAKKKAEPNEKAGAAYVAEQKKKDASIKTLPSGVSYKVVKEGNGAKPSKNSDVKVIYTGKHIDGTEFDSSKGQAVQFNVSGVVPGFSEILQLMAPGAKYVAYLPADQAYGTQGAGENIKPGETLVFEIEMVSVEPDKTSK